MRKVSVATEIAWQVAAYEAREAGHRFIEKEHLLIGILSLEKAISHGSGDLGLDKKAWDELVGESALLSGVVRSFGIDQPKLRRTIREHLGSGDHKHSDKVVHRSDECRRVFRKGAEYDGSSKLTTLALAAAIIESRGALLDSVFGKAVIDAQALRNRLLSSHEKRSGREEGAPPEREDSQSFLELYGRDLTQAAREGRLGPFIGRRSELLQVVQTLARSGKNNPVLVGEAGVGKTAVVEALAVRVAEGKDPQVLSGAKIIELNLGAIVAGTNYRGEFEERLTRILQEVRSDPSAIIFIDEIHNLVGAGRAGGGSMDAANIMKPALARGDIKCIGATTIGEYRRYIEADPALERRFEKILVNEPSRDEAMEILEGLRPKWEKHFNAKITSRALESAVDLSVRFDTDHQLPDKAIDLVDKAGARIRVPFLSKVFGKAPDGENVERDGDRESVTEHTVAEVLSEKIGVPLEVIRRHLEGVRNPRLAELSSYLKKRIVGQDGAIERVSQRLLMAYTGMGRKGGPLAVFLFLGPTGVGKTEMAKAIADFVFGGESGLIRLDMSEYMEEHSVAKLIGSPPGYAGYEEEGQFTGKLRSKPYSIVLLDEAEKAHPRIFDIFLQVFDEGRITDAKGRTVDARNAIFIMTSNIKKPDEKRRLGFLPGEEDKKTSSPPGYLQSYFRPELLNRIDEQIVFQELEEDDVREILKPMMEEICANLKKMHNASLTISPEAEESLIQRGYSKSFGVRELQRTVEKFIRLPLSNLILSGKLKGCKSWQVICVNEEISIAPLVA